VFRILIDDNDAHVKNFGFLHGQATGLTDVSDAVPSLHQAGWVSYDLALAVDGEFGWRRMTAERIRAGVQSWGLLPKRQAETIIAGAVQAFADASEESRPPRGATPGLRAHFLAAAERLS
jgi:serine/threonine-protein kinase HipA